MDYEPFTCNSEEFIHTYLPKDGLSNFNLVIAELEARKVLAPITQSKTQHTGPTSHGKSSIYGLKAFKGVFRSGSSKPSRVAKSLQAVWSAVRAALGKIKGGDVNAYSIREVEEVESSVHTCLSANIDASATLRSTDVVVPFRVATKSRGDNESASDPLPDFLRVINEDARRKHMYAITIEDADMSLWYLSRSQCVKSIPFDMTKQPHLLVQAFISLMTTTDERLGYDPLVFLLPNFDYVYKLPPEEGREDSLYYQTIELVSQFHSDDPVGRSARVWKVKQVLSPTDMTRVPGTSDRILKDVCLDARMKPEADIQRQLFADISAFGKRSDWRYAEALKDMREEDIETLADALGGDNYKKYFSCIIASHVGESLSHPALPSSSDIHPSHLPKRRCFYLYEFICTPLFDIAKLGEAIDIIKQCVTALRLMYCAGWIHRDISAGNILAIRSEPEAPWEMKLSDLEFARKFPDADTPKGEKPIGTPFFMSCELQAGMPFAPDEENTIDSEDESESERQAREARWREPPRPVLHNYQHDLESIWWIILWLITARVRGSWSREWSNHFFKHSTDSWHGRTRCMLLASMEPLDSSTLFPRDLPQGLYSHSSNFLRSLNSFKHDLRSTYKMRYRVNGQEDPGSYSWMMGKGASKFFRSIEKTREAWASVQLMVETELRALKQAASKAPLSNKRKMEAAVADVANRVPADEQETQPPRPRKRPRLTAPDSTNRLVQRSRPVTRSMTREQRNAGPTTRSMTRRLQQSATGTSQPRYSNRRPRS